MAPIDSKKIIFLVAFSIPLLAAAQSFTFEKTSEGALVMEHGKKVLFYQSATKSKNGLSPRADYIHPLYGLDGEILTEDFPEGDDFHLHHRGLFWSWQQVYIEKKSIGIPWECKDFIWDVQNLEMTKSDENSLTFSAKTFWKSPLWNDDNGKMKAFVEENATVIVHAETENYRIIDFEITLLALEPQVRIGGTDDNKGLGGFSIRMKLPDDIQFTAQNGEVKPITNQLNIGPWVNISGSLAKDGGHAGIAILTHPNNPVFPNPWILRAKKSMQNPVYPGRYPVLVSEKDPTILRYRLVIYKGKVTNELLNSIQDKY